MDRTKALDILDQWISKDFTRKHLLATEACMRAYAERFEADGEQWGLAGLLHDTDWDKFPDEHPAQIVALLKEDDEPEMAQAIASHGNNSAQYGERFTARESLMDRALFACDEITGFIIAVALVRPNKLDDLKLKSVKKKLKDKAFAAQVNRAEIYEGPEKLGIEFDEHLQIVIAAMQGAELQL